MKATFRYFKFWPFVGIMAWLLSCTQANSDTDEEDTAGPVVPVQVGHARTGSLSDNTELSATSAYLQKSYVKANINGYVKAARVQVGQQVHAHELLFNLITKEAMSIGNAVNQLDSAFQFSGVSPIRAHQAGFITSVNHQQGDYVQDGEPLAVISNQGSFVFLLELPYELRSVVQNNPTIALSLPDGETLTGTPGGSLPTVDSLSQTQRVIIHVKAPHVIPEGLIASVKITRAANDKAQILPRSAVLSNETEDEFWVMKLINDSTAIKVRVKKGLENGPAIEITDPLFDPKDRLIISGNYGIADTAKVQIIP